MLITLVSVIIHELHSMGIDCTLQPNPTNQEWGTNFAMFWIKFKDDGGKYMEVNVAIETDNLPRKFNLGYGYTIRELYDLNEEYDLSMELSIGQFTPDENK